MNARAQAPRLLYATILLLSLTEFLQAGMTAFAAAPIMGELGMGPEEFSLVAAVYASVAILAISMQRWFVERIGGRRLVQLCAALAVGGAILCARSHEQLPFLAGRTSMALGGGAFFTSSRMIIHHRLEGPKRFIGIRCLASGLAIGIAAAPWLAATAVSHDTWAAIYWTIAGLAAAVFVLAGLSLPAAPPECSISSEMQAWQQLLLLCASFAMLNSLQRLYYDFYGDRLPSMLTFACGAAGMLFYLREQAGDARPLLRLRELLRVRYLFGLAMFSFAYLMLGANNYVIPTLLLGSLGYAWETVGHVEALGLSAALLTWIVLSRLLQRSPAPRKYLVTGFAALTSFGLLLSRIDSGANAWTHVLPALALNSIFLLTVLPVTAMQSFRDMEHDESVFSHAQQLKNMMGQAGIAIGITVATIGQQWRTAVHYSALSAQLNPYNPVFTATVEQLQRTFAAGMAPAEAGKAALARVAQMLAQQASMLANIDHFAAIAVLGALGMAVILRQGVFR